MTRSPTLGLLLATVQSSESSIIERCFHFGVGAALSALLLVLALRSSGENRIARLGFAACGLTFTLFACVGLIVLSFGQRILRCGGLAIDDSWAMGTGPLFLYLEAPTGPSGSCRSWIERRLAKL